MAETCDAGIGLTHSPGTSWPRYRQHPQGQGFLI
jgi:hypothetical protein